ncbi:hypothetical protein, partial [Salmonella enterica]|uniref:hypothetical protein n=1 Tax=Salmonella enterica TaxID=28901 RepID=UPI0020C56141
SVSCLHMLISLDMEDEFCWLTDRKKIIVDTKLGKNVLSDQERPDELNFLKFIGNVWCSTTLER